MHRHLFDLSMTKGITTPPHLSVRRILSHLRNACQAGSEQLCTPFHLPQKGALRAAVGDVLPWRRKASSSLNHPLAQIFEMSRPTTIPNASRIANRQRFVSPLRPILLGQLSVTGNTGSCPTARNLCSQLPVSLGTHRRLEFANSSEMSSVEFANPQGSQTSRWSGSAVWLLVRTRCPLRHPLEKQATRQLAGWPVGLRSTRGSFLSFDVLVKLSSQEEKQASIEGFGFDKSASVVGQDEYANSSEVNSLEKLWNGKPDDIE